MAEVGSGFPHLRRAHELAVQIIGPGVIGAGKLRNRAAFRELPRPPGGGTNSKRIELSAAIPDHEKGLIHDPRRIIVARLCDLLLPADAKPASHEYALAFDLVDVFR